MQKVFLHMFQLELFDRPVISRTQERHTKISARPKR